MRNLFENKVFYAVTVFLFAVGFAWNAKPGPRSVGAERIWLLSDNELLAHGPVLPPDPWEGGTQVKHGPVLPPDPWEGGTLVAHGPVLPPDPWEGGTQVKHGPVLPPDPWEGGTTAAA